MKNFVSFISEASLIDRSDTYPPGTQVVLKKTGSFGKELINTYSYKEGSLFTIENPRTASTNIIDLSKQGEDHYKLKVKGEDGYVFLLKGSKNAIQSSFGNLSASGRTGKLNATFFEVDIVNEIQARNGKPKSNKTANNTPAAEALAVKIVDSIQSVAGAPTSAFTLSGNPERANLTQVYRDFGVTVGESKTDIGIVIQKTHLCTVKKKEESQFASAQANECSAVIQAVFMNDPAKQDLARRVADIVKMGMTKENFYKLREKNRNFDQLLATVLGLRSGATISRGDMKALNTMMEEIGLTPKITGEITNFLSNDDNKKAVFAEFITGAKRFVNEEYIPDTLLAWGSDGSVVWKDIQKYIDEAYSKGAFKYNIRDRGTGRGGALRLEPIRMEEMNPEEKTLYIQLVEEFDRDMDSMILQEGIFRSIRGGLAKVGSFAMDVIRWVAEAAKKIWSFVAALITKGVGVLMQVFGIEATATIRYGPF